VSVWRWVESIVVLVPVRLVLGGAFVVAAWMKLFDRVWQVNPVTGFHRDPTFAFAESIAAYKILDPARHEHAIAMAAYMLPWGELVGGVLLVIGLWTRSAALLIGTLLVMFTAANLSVIFRPDVSASCACFGSLEWPCGGSVTWCQVVRNVVLLTMAGYVLWRGGGAVGFDRDRPRGGACLDDAGKGA